jgi:hypothetical protein
MRESYAKRGAEQHQARVGFSDWLGARRSASVVVPPLKERNPTALHEVDDSMFFSEAPGPNSSPKMPERFWLTNPMKWIPHDCFNQSQKTQRNLSVGFHPEPKILAEL